MITGDFNPVSTGFNAKRLRQLTGPYQIINFWTRNDSVLDWCVINLDHLGIKADQLPPVGSSDHNSIMISSYMRRSHKPRNDRFLSRDFAG